MRARTPSDAPSAPHAAEPLDPLARPAAPVVPAGAPAGADARAAPPGPYARPGVPGSLARAPSAAVVLALGLAAPLAAVALLLGVPAPASAQRANGADPPAGTASAALDPLANGLPRLTAPVRFDGVPDEDAWARVPVLPVVEHWPEFGADRTSRTRIRVAHDGESLWIGGDFLDAPGRVRAGSLLRDRWLGDDALDLVIDGTNDDATGLKFTTTPLGIRLDGEIRNDAVPSAGIQAQNSDWNGFWEARSARSERGWSTEMRIPLEILGVTPADGRAVLGLLVSRYFAGSTERDIYPAVPPDWPMAELKPSRGRDVELRDVSVGRPLFVTPYLLTGLERTRGDPAASGARPDTRVPLQVGGDLRVGLRPGVSLDLTVNTDFAQAESDELLVNLDRLNLFFPEKRPFFQERSSTFESSLGSEIRLFHSRRIGIGDEGRARRIVGGARVTGTSGPWDFGALGMHVEAAADQPAETDAVVRVSRGWSAAGARLGGIATARLREGGGEDLTAGLDLVVQSARWGGLTVQAAWTEVEGPQGDPPADASTSTDGSVARVAWERSRTDGLGWFVEGVRAGPDFRPRLGFVSREPFSSLIGELTHGWRLEGGRVRRVTGIVTTRAFWRTADGSLQSALQRFRAQVLFGNGLFWNTALNLTHEHLDQALSLPGATVPAGTFRGVDLFTNVWLNSARKVSGFAVVHVGRAFDGWRTFASLEPRVALPPHASIAPVLTLNRLHFPDRGETVVADALGLRLTLALDARLSMEGLVQYNRAADRVAGNVRLRAHLGEGRDVWLVYDGVRDLAPLDEELAGMGRTDGRLLLKVTHTLRW